MPQIAKPRALRVLSGEHTELINPNEPQPTLGAIPPSWLPRRGVAWTTWQKHVKILGSVRVMTEADSDALAIGCLALQEALASKENWHRAEAAWNRYWRCLIHFGLTPASRTKLSSAPEDPVDPLAAWKATK